MAEPPAMGYADLIDDLISATYPVPPVSNQHAAEDAPQGVNAFELVSAGNVEELERLLHDDSIAVNRRDPTSGRALLHEACVSGNLEIVKLLVQHPQIDLMLRTMMGRCTSLHLAVTSSHRTVVFMLLSHGADALSRDRFGCSAMHYVKSITVAKLLVQYGGKVLDCNSKKKTALESVEAQEEETTGLADAESVKHAAARVELVKYLRSQAEVEFKAKLELLRQMRKQAKQSTQSNRKARRNGARVKTTSITG